MLWRRDISRRGGSRSVKYLLLHLTRIRASAVLAAIDGEVGADVRDERIRLAVMMVLMLVSSMLTLLLSQRY